MNIQKRLNDSHVWLVTGCAGFIGSHIVEKLLLLNQRVRGIDNLSSGSKSNLDQVLNNVGESLFNRFTFIEGSILEKQKLSAAVEGARFILHQAAIVSVPETIIDPVAACKVNVEGFAAVAKAAEESKIQRIIYASSSAVYGDDPKLPKKEEMSGRLLSPYAASKRSNELFAEAFGNCSDIEFVGLRYFNVFGPRQDPNGPYAAVIPLWIDSLLSGGQAVINGDPGITRDFIFVEDVVEANIKAALAGAGSANRVFNIASGKPVTLKELHSKIAGSLRYYGHTDIISEPAIGSPRLGDIKYSYADIQKAKELLGFSVSTGFEEGIRRTIRH